MRCPCDAGNPLEIDSGSVHELLTLITTVIKSGTPWQAGRPQHKKV